MEDDVAECSVVHDQDSYLSRVGNVGIRETSEAEIERGGDHHVWPEHDVLSVGCVGSCESTCVAVGDGAGEVVAVGEVEDYLV